MDKNKNYHVCPICFCYAYLYNNIRKHWQLIYLFIIKIKYIVYYFTIYLQMYFKQRGYIYNLYYFFKHNRSITVESNLL